MPVDPSKLRSAVRRLSKGSGTRAEALGITASIRKLLPDIQRLREDEGATWRVIAAALAEQGVTEGQGKPLSERRLTSIVTKLKAQATAKAERIADRERRTDIATREEPRTPIQTPPGRRRPGPLAGEFEEVTPAQLPDEAPLTEDDILRAQRDKHRHLFKKD